MKLDKVVNIFMLVLVIAGGSYYFSNQAQEKVEDQAAGVVFLSSLMGKINQIGQIVITDKNTSTHLSLKNTVWTVDEMSGYAAEFSKVKMLLLALAEMKTIEAKTAKPVNYGRLGVQGPNEPGEVDSKEIQLLDKAGNLQYTLIVGKQKMSRTPGAKPAVYVRLLREEKSWLVSGTIELPAAQLDWLNKQVIDIDAARIQSVEIKQPKHNVLRISKKAASDENFDVENLPVNASLTSASEVNAIANVLENLVFDNVLKRGGFQANNEQMTTAVFETFEGLRLLVKLWEKEGKHFIGFDVTGDLNNETAIQESQTLNAKFALWIYEIPTFKADRFKKILKDLVQLDQTEE